MASLNSNLCRVGDVILFYGFGLVGAAQGAAKGLKVLTAIPSLISAAQGGGAAFQGSSNANHAAIITAIGPNHTPFEMSHATNAGVATVDVDTYLLGYSGSCQVFRMNHAEYPAMAGRVGGTWSAPAAGLGAMPYSVPKGFLSAFQSSSYGPGAKQRADFYRANRDQVGGPADFKNLADGRAKAMFCSMFVIACYQAVMPDAYVEQMLALDAKHTSPMYFDGYLKGSQHWQQVNAAGP